VTDTIEVPKFLTRAVDAAWLAECRRKQDAYAAHRRANAALWFAEAPAPTPSPPLRGKIHDRRQERLAL